MLEATHAVELELNVVLPPGFYAGTEIRIGLETTSGVSWTKPEYTIELTADQLASIGVRISPNVTSAKYDVTTFVRSGELTVT